MWLAATPTLLQWSQGQLHPSQQNKTGHKQKLHPVKTPEQIPYQLMGELMQNVSPDEWIAVYKSQLKR